MRKIVIFILTCTLYSSHLYGQWSQHAVNYDGNQSIFFTSNDTGYVAGINGRILKTTDGGLNWSLNLNLGMGADAFNSIYFPTKDTGYAAMQSGVQVYKSVNAGSTWTQMSAPAGSFESMSFVNSDLGFACGTASGIGAAIFKTINGGTNWTIYGLTSQTTVNDIQFLNSQLGYAVGWTWSTNVGYFYKTTDGGLNWTTHIISALPEQLMLTGLYFTDSLTGYVIGEKLSPSVPNYFGVVYKTVDGGSNWTSINIPSASYLLDIKFVNDSVGYIGGNLLGSTGCFTDILLKTENKGGVWSLAYTGPSIYGIKSLSFPSEDIGYAIENCTGTGAVGSFLKYEANANCFAHYSVDADSATSTFTLFVDSISSSQAVSYYWDFGDGTTSTLENPSHVVNIDTAYNVCMTVYNIMGDSCTYCHLIGKDYLSNIIRDQGYTINVENPDITTEQPETSKKRSIRIFPNPASDFIEIGQIEHFNSSYIKIYDMFGKTCLEKKINSKIDRINIAELANGFYMVEIISDGKISTLKLVVN